MLDNRDKQTVVVLLAVGLVVRLVYFLEYRSLLEFLHPTVDALYHHLSAKAIAAGALTSSEPFFRAPFYNYFLGLIYAIAGDSISAARFFQLLIGSFTAPLVYLLGREVFDRRVGLVAAIAVLLTGDIVYFEGELVLEASAMWLILVSLLLLVRYIKEPSVMTLAGLGLSTGLAIVDRPNAIVILPLIAWVIWRNKERNSHSPLLRHAIAFTTIMMIPVGLVLLHNVTRTEPALTIATQGGVNFYIGNNEAADGVSAVMPGRLGYNWQYADIKYAAETEMKSKLTPSQVSSHYFGQGIKSIISNPTGWLSLMAKKTALIFSGNDISNNRNLPAFKSELFLFKLLPMGMGILAPLGIIGMLVLWRRSRAAQVVILFVVLYAASFIAFFVNSRFRLPLLPILAILAAALVFELFERFRNRQLLQGAVSIAGVAILAVFLNVNLYGMQFDNRQQAAFNKGNLYLETGELPRAIDSYYEAISFERPLQQVHLNLGIAFLKTGQLDSAWNHFITEDSLFNGSAEAMNNLAYLYRQTGQTAEALIAAEAAVAEKPYLPEARLNYWYALREAGLADSAYSAILREAATTSLGRNEKFILAISAIDLRRFGEADTLLRSIIAEQTQSQVPTYSEASSASSISSGLAPTVFDSRVFYNLALSLAGRGEIDSAIVYLEEAVKNDPGLSEGWTNLGSAYFTKKDYPQAIEALEQARKLSPESEIVLFNLALSYYSTGDKINARKVVEECVRLHPSFTPSLQLLETLKSE